MQEAIARVYPVGPEEARQEWLEHQQEKEQLAARRREIEATKQRRKGRPSAAEQGLRSAVRNYGTHADTGASIVRVVYAKSGQQVLLPCALDLLHWSLPITRVCLVCVLDQEIPVRPRSPAKLR